MKRCLIAILMIITLIPTVYATAIPPEVSATAALLMEQESGTILYEKNAHDKMEPASVTKIMTILLTMEAIDQGTLQLEDTITMSANAVSMGGSQIWLKEGEQMTVEEVLKAVVVVSANDGAVALAEAIAGSEANFVAQMNERATELGMENTTFLNCTGLPESGHLTTAYDIALMSRELMVNHPEITQYTTIWMDTLRDGAFQLSNTNKLIHYYDGATGLKTGSTDSALYCLSATAERDGVGYIAVILQAPTSDDRFADATALLDFGFANYALLDVYPSQAIEPVAILMGEVEQLQPVLQSSSRILVEKNEVDSVITKITVAESVEAPVEQGQKVGEMEVWVGETLIESIPIVAEQEVPRITLWSVYFRLLDTLFMK